MEQLPAIAIQLSSSSGFEQRYFENLKYTDKPVEAYEKTEVEYKQYYKRRRYSNFKSFRETVNNRRRKH